MAQQQCNRGITFLIPNGGERNCKDFKKSSKLAAIPAIFSFQVRGRAIQLGQHLQILFVKVEIRVVKG